MNESLRPDINEQYTSATHASNLKVEADRKSRADILIAAGWAHARLGSALLRLHSEWDSASHPLHASESSVKALADTMDAGQHPLVALGRELSAAEKKTVAEFDKADSAKRLCEAKAAAKRWYLHDMAMLLGRLKSLPDVREQVAIQADRWNMGNPLHVSASILQWWLARQCQACNGTRFEVISGTGRQSGKVCRVCHGSGEAPVPCGEAGKRMAIFINMCTDKARQQIRSRLHSHGR